MNLSEVYQRTKQKERHYIARSLRNAGFKREECRSMGFNISNDLWISCIRYTGKRDVGGAPRISQEIALAISEHGRTISTIASNRTVTVKNYDEQTKELKAVRYMDCSMNEAFRTFPLKEEISFSTFGLYLGKIYKKPHRLTDLCRYCEHGIEIKNQLTSFLKKNNNFDQEFSDKEDLKYGLNTKKMQIYFRNLDKSEERDTILDKINELMAIQFHRRIAKIQRDSYNKMKKDLILSKETILIDLDFKQKIVIGASPRQVNIEYFNQVQKSLLGN